MSQGSFQCMAMLAIFLCGASAQASDLILSQLRVRTEHASEDTTLYSGRKVRSHLDVYYPQADGDMPVLVVVGGLNGLLPTAAYGQFLHNIASRGVIVVVPNGQFLLAERFRERAIEVAAAAEWLPAGLPRLLNMRGRHGTPTPKLDRLFLMGHSSGAQAVLAAYELMPQKVAGVALLDPVDGDPFNTVPHVIAQGARYPASLQALLVTAELCNQPGWNLKWFPVCCPPGVSADHFYGAFTGRRWWANALDFGHVDLLDAPFTLPVNLVGFCKASDGRLPRRHYRNFVAMYVAAFTHTVSWGLAFPPPPDEDHADVRYQIRSN